MAGYEKQARKMSNSGGSNRGRKSEGNLAAPRQPRDVFITPADGERPRSPRKSDGELVRRRKEAQRDENRSRQNNRPRASNERVDRPREDIPPVPPIPPQWTEEARNNNRPLSPHNINLSGQQFASSPRNPQVEEYERLQREHQAKKVQKQPTVDWDAMVKEKNERVRLSAEAKGREEEEKRRAAEQKWKVAEQRRRSEEQAAGNKRPEAVRRREREEYERRKQEATNREDIRQREFEEAEKKRKAIEREAIRRRESDEAERRVQEDKNREAERQRAEKADKRRKVEKAEKKANSEKVKRENELRRLRAFGPLHQRRPTWPSPPATGDPGPQGRPIERSETNPVQQKPVGDSGQQHRRQEPRPPARRNSEPITPQRKDSLQNKPPVLALLTEENLRAQAADSDDSDVDPLGRGLGDNMRTFIYGFAVPTILQSDLTPSLEDEDESEDKNKKPNDKNKNKKLPNK